MLTVLDADGNEVFDQPSARARVISRPVAFQMVTMLREVMERARRVGASRRQRARREDGHDRRLSSMRGSSDSRPPLSREYGLASISPASIGHEAYAARVALPIWADFMNRIARLRPAREFAIPSGLRSEELCRVSRLKPVDRCPVYTEYFKDGDELPTKLCPVHSGSLRQVATRAVQQILKELGNQSSPASSGEDHVGYGRK